MDDQMCTTAMYDNEEIVDMDDQMCTTAMYGDAIRMLFSRIATRNDAMK